MPRSEGLSPLKSYLEELKTSQKPIKSGSLILFSGLSGEEAELLKEAWLSIPLSRRCQVMQRLGEMAEEDVELDFGAAFRVCLSDPDEGIRVGAVDGLWECTERSLIAPLITLVQNDASERVRAAAATGLGRYAMLAAMGKLGERDASRVWTCLLQVVEAEKEPLEVRRRAVESIGAFSFPQVPVILEKAYRSPELNMKCSALYAMGRNCDPRWLPILLNELSSQYSELRYEAANACGEIGEQEVVPHLIPLLEDQDFQIQLAAVSALGAIGGPQALRLLSRCLKDSDERIQEAAQEAMEGMDVEEDPLGFILRN